MSHDNVKALVIRTAEGSSIVGIYTDDEFGNRLLTRVRGNLERKQPDLLMGEYTFMLNTPNQ